MFAAMDDSMKKGLVKDYGSFPDGASGYLIGEGEATDVFIGANTFMPYISSEVHEIIPYDKSKEILRALLKAQVKAAKK